MKGLLGFFLFFFSCLTNKEWIWGKDTDWSAILVQSALEDILLNTSVVKNRSRY